MKPFKLGLMETHALTFLSHIAEMDCLTTEMVIIKNSKWLKIKKKVQTYEAAWSCMEPKINFLNLSSVP